MTQMDIRETVQKKFGLAFKVCMITVFLSTVIQVYIPGESKKSKYTRLMSHKKVTIALILET